MTLCCLLAQGASSIVNSKVGGGQGDRGSARHCSLGQAEELSSRPVEAALVTSALSLFLPGGQPNHLPRAPYCNPRPD